ncbi:hypothetical protein RJT34_11614 [Clitoria ternatea]|uniref:Uncharacterized protein n=1 Tax=Clitoria ternatea TaxID=43366 RepID=A0AAN9JM90_CLITE
MEHRALIMYRDTDFSNTEALAEVVIQGGGYMVMAHHGGIKVQFSPSGERWFDLTMANQEDMACLHWLGFITKEKTCAPYSKPPKLTNLIRTLAIVVVGVVLVLATFLVFILVCCSRKTNVDVFVGKSHKGEMSPEKMVSRRVVKRR